VIRAEEHLSNTPRQVFILEALGYERPQYAHLPFVAEPGSKTKLSKRKLDKYLKNRDFAQLVEHGRKIAAAMGLQTDPDTFNPVITDFYEQVGYLPEAIINYLALLGWALDDKREDFTIQELVEHFSLDRVNKAPASFDPKKLWAFQDRYMQRVPVDRKVDLVVPYLQRAGWVTSPLPESLRTKIAQIVTAAGDRIKTAGDILNYNEFFVADDQLPYDEAAFDKALRKPGATAMLAKYKEHLAAAEPFEAEPLEAMTRRFVESEGIKIGDIIHPLRAAVTGKSIGFGLFDSMAILDRESCRARIDGALGRLATTSESTSREP
jgi:glutamyl-tRNA synthetase